MNLRVLLLHLGILCLLMGAVALGGTWLGDRLAAGADGLPPWYPLAHGLLSVAVVAAVFHHLGRVQQENLFMHAFTLAVMGWLASYVPNVLVLHQPFATWRTGVAHLLLIGVIAAVLGRSSAAGRGRLAPQTPPAGQAS